MSSNNQDIYISSDGDEDYYKSLLKEEFSVCLQQINQKTFGVKDFEFSPFPLSLDNIVDSQEHKLYKSLIDDSHIGESVPLASAKNALNIIIKHLDSGWDLNDEMREYLSSRFKKSINETGSRLQSLFHLRGSEGDEEKNTERLNIGRYVFFRMRLNIRLKTKVSSKYLNKTTFAGMLSDEIGSIFKVRKIDESKIKRYAKYALQNDPFFFYSRHIDFLCAHQLELKKYWKYTRRELNKNKRKVGEWRNIREDSINWISDEFKVYRKKYKAL